jgi:hypothetical protein
VALATPDLQPRSGVHSYWGVYANALVLPNVAGSPNNSGALEVGDFAYVTSIGSIYICRNATPGLAVWVAIAAQDLENNSFSAYNAVGGLTFAGATTLVLDTERFVSSALYTLAGNEVTVNDDGRYLVHYFTTFERVGNSRGGAISFLERNAVQEPGTITEIYIRSAGYGTNGAVTAILDLTAADVLRVRGQVLLGGGSASQIAEGTGLTIMKLN